MQWGSVIIPVNESTVSCSFPTTFVQITYSVTAIHKTAQTVAAASHVISAGVRSRASMILVGFLSNVACTTQWHAFGY